MPEKVNGNKFSGKSNIASLNSSSTSIDSKSAVQLNSTEHKLATLQKMADNSPYSQRFAQLKSLANKNTTPKQPVSQLSRDSHSLPDNVKHGVESLSGISMDDVKVHYNSAKPAQLNAHAYAQGTDIHIASGQEKHLPHEAWHVVQQKQGRVQPTTMMKAKVPINDDAGLEKEADVMGARALQMKPFSLSDYKTGKSVQRKGIIQRAPFADPEFNEADVYPNNDGIVKYTDNPLRKESSKKLDLKGVTPVSENEDVTEFFRDFWDMIEVEVSEKDAKAAYGDTTPEGPKESAKEKSGAAENSEEASTQAVEKKEEKETITYIEQVYRYIKDFFSKQVSEAPDNANAVAGNGVVSNAQGILLTPIKIAEAISHFTTKINKEDTEAYNWLTAQEVDMKNVLNFANHQGFTGANGLIAPIMVLKDSADLFPLIIKRMREKGHLSDKEKESVNELLNKDIGEKVLNILQGGSYGANSAAEAAKVGAETVGAALEIAGAATHALPILGIIGSGFEFLRGGYNGTTAHYKLQRLDEIMKEINALKDDEHPGLAELKSKFKPIEERVEKSRSRNFARSTAGAIGVISAGLVLGGAVSVATGGLILIPAVLIGASLAGLMLYGKFRAKKESRQQLAKYLYETSLQDGGTGDSAKKIVKALIADEKLANLEPEDLIKVIAKNLKTN